MENICTSCIFSFESFLFVFFLFVKIASFVFVWLLTYFLQVSASQFKGHIKWCFNLWVRVYKSKGRIIVGTGKEYLHSVHFECFPYIFFSGWEESKNLCEPTGCISNTIYWMDWERQDAYLISICVHIYIWTYICPDICSYSLLVWIRICLGI